ncbi:ankyrin repeat domain-containing protein [Ruminococcaceae bacterium OttesenSCG-928-L11]|nr:ankyrin repeat domain-containing protein [Ruminococcaceae bacterium OttesenSCG-928-L11]
MKPIKTVIWKPSPHDPSKQEYVGQRSALEVFEELRYHLESIGYLPDEYFLLDSDLRDGQEFPRDSYLFCTTDYGGNEGIYVDVSLRIPKDGGGFTTRNFATGKTLGESNVDLDKMFLTASAITKAFHSDGIHSRYMMVGRQPEPEGVVMHLTPQEQRLIVDALVLQRNQALEETHQVEQLLQRATGGITQFIDQTGMRPLWISDMDHAKLAIRDGDLDAFYRVLSVLPEESVQLLPMAAGRPGRVGMEMTEALLEQLPAISPADYLHACEQAVEIGDTCRAKFLLEQAEHHVQDLDLSLYGEVIQYAFMSSSENRRGVKMARDLAKSCTTEQIAAADPQLLVCAANFEHHQLVRTLVDKGIDANVCAADLIHTLDRHREGWQITSLLRGGMKIDPQNYAALGACIDIGNAEAAEILLRQGMDFDGYTAWAAQQHLATQNTEVEAALAALWDTELSPTAQEQEQSAHGIQINM